MLLKEVFTPFAQASGIKAENFARSYLEKNGFIFIDKNFHWRRGEIDLIMKDGETLVFIEVRYRTNSNYGSGAESITAKKRQKIIMSAQYYLSIHPQLSNLSCRFDVVSVSSMGQKLEAILIKNAFDAA